MPVEFLSEEQEKRYGRYAGEPSPEQLAKYFYLDNIDSQIIKERRGNHNRLGLALQLCTVRFLGTFLTDPIDVPLIVIDFLAKQLAINDTTCLERYRNSQTRWEHSALIKQRYGYQDFHAQPAHWRLVRWLYQRSIIGTESQSLLFDLTTARLVERRILLPGVSVLARLIASVRERAAKRLWNILSKLPNQKQIASLEKLLLIPENQRYSTLDRLRHSPTRVNAKSLVAAINRLEEIRAVGIGDNVVTKTWTRLVLSESGVIDRKAYTFCILQCLRSALRRRDIFVVKSQRYCNPRAKLLSDEAWAAQRAAICRTLDLEPTFDKTYEILKSRLDEAYYRTAANFKDNTAVRIEIKEGKEHLVLTPLDRLVSPPSFITLTSLVTAMLPRIDLPEVLLEIDAKTGFTKEFTHLNQTGSRVKDLHISVCAVLLAEACNIGLEPLIRPEVPALTRGRLSWVQQNYIRSETLLRAKLAGGSFPRQTLRQCQTR